MGHDPRLISLRLVMTATAFFVVSSMFIRLLLFLPVFALQNDPGLPFTIPAGGSIRPGLLLGVLAAELLAAMITARFLLSSTDKPVLPHATCTAMLCAAFILLSPGIAPVPAVVRILLAAASFAALTGTAFHLCIQGARKP